MKNIKIITLFFFFCFMQNADLRSSSFSSMASNIVSGCLTTIGNNKMNTVLAAASATNLLLDIKFSCSSISTTEEKVLLLYSGLAGLSTVYKLLNKNSAFDRGFTGLGLFGNLGSFGFRSWGYRMRADELTTIKRCSDRCPVNLTAPRGDGDNWVCVPSHDVDRWLSRNNCLESQVELIKILCTVNINNVEGLSLN